MPLNIDFQQILLHLFNFVILFAMLYFLLYKPVKKFMDSRTEYYKKLDDEARANLTDAEKLKKEYADKLAGADAEISEIKDAARRELEEKNALRIKQTEEEAAKILADARQNGENARKKLLKEAQKEISDLAAAAAEKLMINSTTSDAYDMFLNAAKGENNDDR